MANFIKVLILGLIVVGAAIYFFKQEPQFFRDIPLEKTLSPYKTYISQPAPPSSPAPALSTSNYTETKTEIPESSIPKGFTREQLSPDFQKILISSASASAWGDYPTTITVYSRLSKEENINITGWRIKSNRRELTIPQAVGVYEPSGAAPEGDIILSGNEYVYIYSTRSPIGRNFRLNKCTGYLENTSDFEPALPRSCPTVKKEEISHLSGQCQSYIFSLGVCQPPNLDTYNSLPGTDQGNECRAFLSNINFNSCFTKYSRDSDFLSNQWRVWVNQNILDSQHDRLLLFDKEGKVVDDYIY